MLATKQPRVMTATERRMPEEGQGFRKRITLKMRLTKGVQRLIAPYLKRLSSYLTIHQLSKFHHIGMFIPWSALRLSVECSAKHMEAGKASKPSRHVYGDTRASLEGEDVEEVGSRGCFLGGRNARRASKANIVMSI